MSCRRSGTFRDSFKSGGQNLVLLSTPGATLPAELQNDVMVIDEPLPSADELADLVLRLFEDAELKVPSNPPCLLASMR